MVDCLFSIEVIDLTNHFIEGAEPKLGHVLAHLLCDEEEEIDDVLGLTGELFSQGRVLRGNTDRASAQMTLAHHDAAHGNERSRRESEFFCSE